MASKSTIERLWDVNQDAEIWWDSSPLIYDNWCAKMIAKAENKQDKAQDAIDEGELDDAIHEYKKAWMKAQAAIAAVAACTTEVTCPCGDSGSFPPAPPTSCFSNAETIQAIGANFFTEATLIPGGLCSLDELGQPLIEEDTTPEEAQVCFDLLTAATSSLTCSPL